MRITALVRRETPHQPASVLKPSWVPTAHSVRKLYYLPICTPFTYAHPGRVFMALILVFGNFEEKCNNFSKLVKYI